MSEDDLAKIDEIKGLTDDAIPNVLTYDYDNIRKMDDKCNTIKERINACYR